MKFRFIPKISTLMMEFYLQMPSLLSEFHVHFISFLNVIYSLIFYFHLNGNLEKNLS